MTTPRLLVCAPLRLEERALRRVLGSGAVLRTGYGIRRSARSVDELLARVRFDALAVAGLAGGVTDDVRSGDVVVATEVRGPGGPLRCASAPLLADLLRTAGLPVRCGPVATREDLVRGAGYGELARAGALAVDMESSVLAAAAGTRPLAVVRVVVDTPSCPLARWDTPRRALRALRRLREVGPVLGRWAAAVAPPETTAPEEVS